MELAACHAFPELPWLADRGQTTFLDELFMRGVCRACGVCDRCSRFVAAENICGGFWAGQFRDQGDEAGKRPAGVA